MSEVTVNTQDNKQPITTDSEASLDDLRQLAIQEFDNQPQPTQTDNKQNRDEKGRFAAPKDAAQPEDTQNETTTNDPSDDNTAPTIYRRVIDVGDGAGPEVFEAESLEELVDKIADAKAHATKKIREQQKKLSALETQAQTQTDNKKVGREFTADEEFVFSQELLSKPTEAIKKLFKEVTGCSIEEFATVKQKQDAIDQVANQRQAADAFIASHPDYVDNDRNSKLIVMATKGQPLTTETFHKAYLDLKESGLLELKTENANDGQDDSQDAQTRIAATPSVNNPPQRTRKASGITTQNRTQPAARRSGPTPEELEKMPLDKLRALAIQEWDAA